MKQLSELESKRLERLETVIQRGQQTFIEVGKALAEIRDSRLYKAAHGTFEAYCKERWHWTRRRAYQLIDSANVAENVNRGTQIPASERQIRPLAKLDGEEQYEAWKKAHEIADDEPVTSTHVKQAVQDIIEDEPPTAEIYQAVAESHADKAIVWINEIDTKMPGAKEALGKIVTHCNKRLGELHE